MTPSAGTTAGGIEEEPMKLLRRATALFVCLALVLIAASGCGGKKPHAKAPSKKPKAASSAKAPASNPSQPPSAAVPGAQPLIPGLQPVIPGTEPLIPSLQPPATGAQPPVPAGRPAPKDLLRALRARYASLNSVKLAGVSRTTLISDGKVAGKTPSQKFRLTFKRPDKFDYDMPESRMVSNGKTVYTYVVEPKRYVKSDASGQELRSLVSSHAGVGIWGLLLGVDYEAAISSMKLLNDSKLTGRDVYVLSMKLKPGVGCPPGSSAVQKLYVGKADLLVWRNELTMTGHPKAPKDYKGKAPKVVERLDVGEMTSIEVNPKLADSAFRFTPPPGAKPYQKPKPVDVSDKPAPDFSYKLTDGSEKRISDLRGKVVVLDIWALPPAEKHLPVLQKIYERYKDQVEFVTINVNEKADKVDEYLKTKGFTFPTAHVTPEIVKVGTEGYGVHVIPTVFIIDAQGIVRLVITGDVTEADLAAKIDKIKGQ